MSPCVSRCVSHRGQQHGANNSCTISFSRPCRTKSQGPSVTASASCWNLNGQHSIRSSYSICLKTHNKKRAPKYFTLPKECRKNVMRNDSRLLFAWVDTSCLHTLHILFHGPLGDQSLPHCTSKKGAHDQDGRQTSRKAPRSQRVSKWLHAGVQSFDV